jgi:biopolymer transport protein ExbD
MADIAFLLIVFFLVTTTMNQDKGLSLHLPPVAETKEVREKNICNVWINAEDEIAFFEREQLTRVAFSDLRASIEQRLAANDKLIVSLKAEREATYRIFVEVLDELKLSGATRISIAEPEEG